MYSDNQKNYAGPIAVIIAVLVFGGIIAGRALLGYLQNPGGASNNGAVLGNEEGQSILGALNLTGPVEVMLLTSDTKAEWLHTVTAPFNAARRTTASGKPILVSVVGHGSPGESQQRIVNGELQPILWSPGDISWIETANQIMRDRGQQPLVTEDCPRLVYAATGFAMWRPMAEALGWPDAPIGWGDIVNLAADPEGWASYGHPEWGQFKFGHTHPAHSSTGFSMMANLAYTTLNERSGLTPEKVKSPEVIEAFRLVENNTFHYGTSTRSLMTLMATRGPAYLHAVTSSETSMLKNNEVFKDTMRFPFVFIFPADGTFWSDNPACLVEADWVSEEQREAALIYRDYLLEYEQQDMAVTIGLRPSDPTVAMHDPISLEFGTDPRVSPQSVPPLESVDGRTAEALIDVFEQTKKKATIIVALDVSQSMLGEKIENAVAGTVSFLNHLAKDDEIFVYVFNHDLVELQPSGRVGEVVETLSGKLETLYAKGNTRLYDTVCQAVYTIQEARLADIAAGENRLYGVVVLSDGEDTYSDKTEADMFNCLPSGEDVTGVKVFTIAYGEDADEDLLLRIATRTNGKTYTGDPETIDQIYLAISSEQ